MRINTGVTLGNNYGMELEELNRQLEQEKSILLEQLKVASRSCAEYDLLKTNFISNISHEMRTPLNAIVGFSELPFMGDVSLDEMMEYMQIIRKSGLQLLEKIKDIIFISTLDAADIPVILQSVSVNNIFTNVETFYREVDDEIGTGPTELVFNHSETKHINFISDAEKINQILKKLIDNALKFTQQGVVEVGCIRLNEHHIEFYVSDTGIGIPSDKFDIIFKLFRMANETPEKQHGGSGLGLYIVHRLITLLGTRIKLQSEVGSGTRISFTLDLNNQ